MSIPKLLIENIKFRSNNQIMAYIIEQIVNPLQDELNLELDEYQKILLGTFLEDFYEIAEKFGRTKALDNLTKIIMR